MYRWKQRQNGNRNILIHTVSLIIVQNTATTNNNNSKKFVEQIFSIVTMSICSIWFSSYGSMLSMTMAYNRHAIHQYIQTQARKKSVWKGTESIGWSGKGYMKCEQSSLFNGRWLLPSSLFCFPRASQALLPMSSSSMSSGCRIPLHCDSMR